MKIRKDQAKQLMENLQKELERLPEFSSSEQLTTKLPIHMFYLEKELTSLMPQSSRNYIKDNIGLKTLHGRLFIGALATASDNISLSRQFISDINEHKHIFKNLLKSYSDAKKQAEEKKQQEKEAIINSKVLQHEEIFNNISRLRAAYAALIENMAGRCDIKSGQHTSLLEEAKNAKGSVIQQSLPKDSMPELKRIFTESVKEMKKSSTYFNSFDILDQGIKITLLHEVTQQVSVVGRHIIGDEKSVNITGEQINERSELYNLIMTEQEVRVQVVSDLEHAIQNNSTISSVSATINDPSSSSKLSGLSG